MHQYIKYLFIIFFGSITILHACDNNNNNDYILRCTLCTNKERHAKKHGRIKGDLGTEESYIVHFNRYHFDLFKDYINTLPKHGNARTNFRLNHAKRVKKYSEESNDSCPSSPGGSPTSNQFFSEDEFEEGKVKKQKTITASSFDTQHQEDVEREALMLAFIKKNEFAINALTSLSESKK